MYEGSDKWFYVVSSRVGAEEEETGNGDVSLDAEVHDGSANCRFPRPSGAIEPENPLNSGDGEDDPVHDHLQDGLSGIRVTLGCVNVVL